MGKTINMISYLKNKPEDELTLNEYARLYPERLEEEYLYAVFDEFIRKKGTPESIEKINRVDALANDILAMGDTEFEAKRAEKIIEMFIEVMGPIII